MVCLEDLIEEMDDVDTQVLRLADRIEYMDLAGAIKYDVKPGDPYVHIKFDDGINRTVEMKDVSKVKKTKITSALVIFKGYRIEVVKSFKTISQPEVTVSIGAKGTIDTIDDHGHAEIDFDDLDDIEHVEKTNLSKRYMKKLDRLAPSSPERPPDVEEPVGLKQGAKDSANQPKDDTEGCSAECTSDHLPDLCCLVCGERKDRHQWHRCPDTTDQRGSFPPVTGIQIGLRHSGGGEEKPGDHYREQKRGESDGPQEKIAETPVSGDEMPGKVKHKTKRKRKKSQELAEVLGDDPTLATIHEEQAGAKE